MKSLFRLLSVVIIIIALLIGCKKNQTSESTNAKTTPIDIQKIESVVKYCTNRVHNSLKTTDSIPYDSVAYYLEATSNYTYGIASAHGDAQKTDSSLFSIPLSNKKAAMTDVRAAYALMIDSVRASYNSIVCANKNLVSVHVCLLSKQSDHITLKAISVVIYGNNSSFGTFDTTDYWFYGRAEQCDGGKCGTYAGTGDPCLDAAKKIQNSVMLRKGTSQGCYVPPFTDVQLWPFTFSNPGWHSADGYNYFRYLFFLNSPSYGNYHDCLMPFEMNRYLGYAEYCVYTEQPSGAKPTDGSSFINIQLIGALYVGGGLEVHQGVSHYGIYLQGGFQSPL
ncbi:MAG: hypothetical protein NTU51_02155 [Bacteroidetes bacterium]|nr:hypothetical protein [Bacteroidota bacterium]